MELQLEVLEVSATEEKETVGEENGTDDDAGTVEDEGLGRRQGEE